MKIEDGLGRPAYMKIEDGLGRPSYLKIEDGLEGRPTGKYESCYVTFAATEMSCLPNAHRDIG